MKQYIANIQKTHIPSTVELALGTCSLVGQVSLYAVGKCAQLCRYVSVFYWQHKVRFCLHILLAVALFTIASAGNAVYQTSKDAQVEHALLQQIDEHVAFKRNIRRSVASVDAFEFMRPGAPEWLRHVGIRAMLRESRENGLDTETTAVLLAIVDRESGFNPLAKAKTTTACGLNQFTLDTGRQFGLTESNCFDPYHNARAQIKHARAILDKKSVKATLAEKTAEERLVFMFRELYCRHHDGMSAQSCSQTAEAMTAQSLPMLFGAYRALQTGEHHAREGTFAMVVFDTFRRMYSRTISLFYEG